MRAVEAIMAWARYRTIGDPDQTGTFNRSSRFCEARLPRRYGKPPSLQRPFRTNDERYSSGGLKRTIERGHIVRIGSTIDAFRFKHERKPEWRRTGDARSAKLP